jgi:dipeptidyl aminopeptidase/acylaminoacyl peptidase
LRAGVRMPMSNSVPSTCVARATVRSWSTWSWHATLGFGLLQSLSCSVSAQPLPVLPVSEYHRVETTGGPRLSVRGAWVAYSMMRPNVDHDSSTILQLHRRAAVGGVRDTVLGIVGGQRVRFSPNEQWVVWSVAPTAAERTRLTAARLPLHNRAVFMNLTTLRRDSLDGVNSAAFDATGRFLLLEQYAMRDSADHRVVTVIDLASNRRTAIGHVAEWRWSDDGSFLALTLGVRDGGPGGLQLFDAHTGRLAALGNAGAYYRHPRWGTHAYNLVALRSLTSRGGSETPHQVVLWPELHRLTGPQAPRTDSMPSVGDSLVVTAHDPPIWSRDGTQLQASVQRRKQQADSTKERRDTLPGVQIWHPSDVQIFPAQQLQSTAGARRGQPVVWDLRSGHARLIDVAPNATIELPGNWAYAFVTTDSAYPWGAKFGRRYHDGYVVDLSTGNTRQVFDSVRYSSASPSGRYLLTFDGRDYHTIEVSSGRQVNITRNLPTTFANIESDTPTDILPPVGRGGWMNGDDGVLLYDAYDVWLVRPDGSGGRRLTRGAEDSVMHRVVVLDTSRRAFDPQRPLYYSLRALWTERRGFARGVPGQPVQRLRLDDRSFWFLTKADSADVLAWQEESRQESPNVFVSDGTMRNATQLSRTNTFMEGYAKSRTELVRFANDSGRPLKGVLLYPVNHDPAKRYPMIVYAYELLSAEMHYHQSLSERVYYNFARWTQEGYFVLLPDVYFRAGDPGVSLLETLRPAVASVVARGLIDPRRVGFVGHSWGGYHGAYVATHSTLFAASVAGAPLTDFLSFMGQIHWGSGTAEVDHWETGQARMGVPYWEDREAHRRNSPIEAVETMTTPLLLAHGTKDRVVEYFQSTVLYNFARRAGKPVVLLTYEDEDHSFQRPANQIDYHRRLVEWFGHFLKREPAPNWISRGVPFHGLEAEKRRVKEQSTSVEKR